MAVLRYFHQDPRQTSVQESSVIDRQGTVLTQKLTTINQSITNNTQVLEDKLNSVPGKSLSTNDFTDEYKNKLRGIEEGAEVNVQSDWGEDDNTADSYIKNKPVIDDIVTQDSENLITSGAVFTAIDELPEPMIFKGSLGTGGTIQTLPAPSADNVGFVYKVITAGAYYGITAKPGDSFISDGSDWILIPSGDEPEGTVMSVGLSVPTGLLVSGSPITTSGTLAITYALGYAIPTTAKLDEWDAKLNAISDLSTIRTNASNGNTAYGWGNHANAGYLAAISDLATIRSNASEGHTAYWWGNHANAGYVKSSGVTSVAMTVPTGLSISGSPITSTGTLALSFANGYSIPTTAKLSNWDTAYGWGNHANAGYVKSSGVTKISTTDGVVGGDITTTGTIKANLSSYTKNTSDIGGKLYAVQLDKSGRLAVNVPWTDHYAWSDITGKPSSYYTLPLAASGTRGGVLIGFTTDAANRNYAVLLSGEKMYVNVPWTDNNTTYSAGSGLSLSGTTFSLALTKALVTTALGYTPPTQDTNTWRGILNNLTSDSTTDSLSAAQGKALANGSARDSTKLPLAGGTMTGNISFSNSGTEFRGINYGTMGDNDQWRIGGAATGSNAGYMEIATADDGNEPIYVRLYTGVFTTLKRTLTLLDASGNTSMPGSVTAGSFVKSGGTSSLFLKADGSVDSNSYITGITKTMVTNALGYTPPTQDTNTTYNFSGISFTSGLSDTGSHDANAITTNGHWYYNANGPATSLGASTTDGALYSLAYSTSWVGLIALDYRNGNLFTRGKNNGTWQSWRKVMYTGDALTKSLVTTALGYTPPTTDTNTWRGITDSYSGTDSSISLSQKGGNSLYNALVNGYANEAGTLAVKYKLTDGSTSSVTGYRLFGSQTLSDGWLNKRIAFLVCDRHTSNGIVFINYGIETAASAYTWNAAYCDIKYFGATSDTSLLMYCYVKLNNTNSITFNFFWNHSDYSNLDIRLLLTWNSPFTISNDGAFVSSIDTNTYGTLKATMQRNEAINADTLDGYHYNNLPYLTSITKTMVTNALGYTPPTSDTNNAVTLTNTATNAFYRVLFSQTADNTTRTEGARKSSDVYVNPNSKTLHSKGFFFLDNLTDMWSDGTNSHPWYGIDHRYPNTGVYSTTITDYFGMTLRTLYGYLVILSGGNVGIGTTAPAEKLHVDGAIRASEIYNVGKLYIQCNTDDSHVIIGAQDKADETAGPWVGIGKVNPSYKLHVNGACGATSFPNTSDIRLKDILSDWLPKLEDIANAPSFLFKWNNIKDDTVHLGSSAQYWEEKAPNVVTEANDEIKTKSLQYDVLGTVNSIAIAKEVVSLKEEIKLLQALIAELKLLLNN